MSSPCSIPSVPSSWTPFNIHVTPFQHNLHTMFTGKPCPTQPEHSLLLPTKIEDSSFHSPLPGHYKLTIPTTTHSTFSFLPTFPTRTSGYPYGSRMRGAVFSPPTSTSNLTFVFVSFHQNTIITARFPTCFRYP